MSALTTLSSNYDLMTDPYVVKLLQEQDDGHDVSQRLQKVFLTGKTYCSTEIRTLFAKAKAMFDELGSSPAEWYIQGCIDRLPGTYQGTNDQLADWSLDEKRHLIDVLQGLRKDVPAHELDTPVGTISRKVQMLLDLLVEIATERPTFTAIAFIEQRVWVAALAEIFSKHPGIGNLFKFGTFVGTSESSKRRGTIANLIEPPNQPTTLDEFRAGRINLILATSVLEEGIDISSCHLVIDFERPKNLKSYVQRRGRARMQESRYIIFLPEVNAGKTPEAWHSLEKEMKAAYMDDLRRSRDANQGEEDEEEAQRYLRVASTG